MRRSWRLGLILAGSAAWVFGSPKIYRIETVAGNPDLGDGGPALAAEIGNIQGLALDRAGNLYLSDTEHHRVRRVGSDGVITTVAGTGLPGFSGDGGPASRAQLNLPYGLAVSPAGNVYIADLGNHRVRRISPDGVISTIVGNGACGSAGDGSPALAAQLCAPRNLLLDPAGSLYVSEFEGHRIRKIAPDGTISRITGTGISGFSGDGMPAYLAQVAFPTGMALDRRGTLYIADSQNQRIRCVTPDGLMNTVFGESAGINLLTPAALAIDRDGLIYVADQSYSIRAYKPYRAWITIAGTGVPAFTGDGGPALSAQLTSANDLTFDPVGNLYIADGMRIRRIDDHDIIQTVAGDGYLRFVEGGGIAAAARLFRPSAVALDDSGHFFIADTGTRRVRKASVSGAIETLTGTGWPGLSGENVPASGASIDAPMGVAVDRAGNILIAETGHHRIRSIAADGRIATVAGTGAPGVGPDGKSASATPLRQPQGVCAGAQATFYVADTANHRVLAVGPDGRVVLAAGNSVPGYSGDEGPARGAQLNQPAACALDPNGNLLIADTLNHRVRRVTPAGAIATVAGSGTAGVSGDEGPATLARLSAPAGVAVDSAGAIYISDTGNHRIRQVTPDGIIHTIAGGDTSGFSGDGGSARAALLDSPGGLAVDSAGNLYFADTRNDRVRRLVPEIEVPPAPVIRISAVNAASLLEGPVAPGEILTIFGDGMGPEEGVAGSFDAAGQLAAEAGRTEVRFDGIPAPVFYAQAGQVNVQVPYTVAGAPRTQVEIRYQQNTVAHIVLPVADASPALFPVAVNPDGSPNSSAEPAARGTIVTVYGTGEGLTDGPNQAGHVAELPYPRPKLPVTVTEAGVAAEILYFGSAPGLVGVFQANVRLPGGYVPPGPVDLVVYVGAVSAPPFRLWLR